MPRVSAEIRHGQQWARAARRWALSPQGRTALIAGLAQTLAVLRERRHAPVNRYTP